MRPSLRHRSALLLVTLCAALVPATGCKRLRQEREAERQRAAYEEEQARKKAESAAKARGDATASGASGASGATGDGAKSLPVGEAYAALLQRFRDARTQSLAAGAVTNPLQLVAPMPSDTTLAELMAFTQRYEGSRQAAQVSRYLAYKSSFDRYMASQDLAAFITDAKRQLAEDPTGDFADEMQLGLLFTSLMGVAPSSDPNKRDPVGLVNSMSLVLENLMPETVPTLAEVPIALGGADLNAIGNEITNRLCVAFLRERCEGVAAIAGLQLLSRRFIGVFQRHLAWVARRSARPDTRRLVEAMVRASPMDEETRSRAARALDDPSPLSLNAPDETAWLPSESTVWLFGSGDRLWGQKRDELGPLSVARLDAPAKDDAPRVRTLREGEAPDGAVLDRLEARADGLYDSASGAKRLALPPRVGDSWTSPLGGTRRTLRVGLELPTPAGLASGCAVTREETTEGEVRTRHTELFCPGLGSVLQQTDTFDAKGKMMKRTERFLVGLRRGERTFGLAVP